jgi:LuxR family maltose regulon positive regulatory protein
VDPLSPVLAAKFAVPEPPPFVVGRTRLLNRLTRGVDEPVTVVTGPAGSGKTQLLASWVLARAMGGTVVWITVERGDDEPAVFWTYVVEGLRHAGLSTVDRPGTAVGHAFLVRLAAALAGQDRPVVLILDGVSNLADPRWATDLDFVLRHADKRLRLVLAGRWDPPLPLYRYRLAGTLSEVRGADLAFTATEAAHLLALHGVELPEPALASLLQHTEGWAAGLRLIAMALQRGGDAEASIAEYFMGEVLSDQPDEVREFLLRTSILDTFTPELAQALTGRGDAQRTLAELERENAFVQPVGERPEAYRYHRLFAELLRGLLAHDEPDEIPQLHRRAAGWFAAEGRTIDAVAHAVTAGDWATAAAIAIGDLAVGRLVLGGAADGLGALFRDVPEDVDSPPAALVSAALALAAGDPDRCAKHLARAEDIPGDGCATAVPLSGRLLDALLGCAYRDASRALSAAEAAESLLNHESPGRLAEHPELRALVLATKGTAQSWLGAIDAATGTLTEAAMAATAGGCEYPRMDSVAHLALIEAYRGRLRHSTALANQAVEVAGGSGLTGEHGPLGAHVALAWVAAEQYDVETAWRHLRAAEPPRGSAGDPLSTTAAAVVKSRLLRARGELRGAMGVLRDADGERPRPVWIARELALSEARLLTASGRAESALAIVQRLTEPGAADAAVVHAAALLAAGDLQRARQVVTPVVEAGHPTPASIDAWLVLAALAADSGDAGRARDDLRNALRLATAESQRRAFHEAGPRLRHLLRDDEELAAQYEALGTSARPARPPSASAGAEPVIVDALSNRELEVLRHVAAMVPTEEIAAAMYVSVNTVKTHLRSALRKLSASRRNEAVRRARALGLL